VVLHCAICGIALTRELRALTDLALLSGQDETPLLPQGYSYKEPEYDLEAWHPGELMVNLADLLQIRHHPDRRRHNGCCGRDGLDGMNLVCVNGHEVGTERSDCCMPHYAHFPPETIRVIED
jgi:hypothetical protein